MSEPKSSAEHDAQILIVDDERAHGLGLLEMIQDEHPGCVWVETAAKALKYLAFGEFELVLTDLRMPKVGGLELLRAIEELDPELPVILLIEEGAPDAAVEAIRALAFDFLWKPVDARQALEAVDRGLRARAEAVEQRECLLAERQRFERRSALLSVLFEEGSDGVLTWDAGGRLVDLSPSILALTGVELERVLEHGTSELFEPEPFGRRVEDLIPELVTTPGAQLSQEVVVRARDGAAPARLMLTVCTLPPAEGGELPVTWVMGLLQPPRRENLRDRLRRADRLAGAAMVSSGAAHEIKNDLGPLLACMSLLDEAKVVEGDLAEVLGAATDCVRRIEAGVERILAPLRPQRPHRRHIDVAELVRESVSFVRRSGHDPRPSLELDVGSALPPILARPDDIHQIVTNLVSNAFEAITSARRASSRHSRERGGAEIRVEVRQDGRHIVLEVHDSGPGIDPASQRRVFEPFFTTKGARGTGLGLTVVRDLVRELGGELSIVSAPVIEGTCVQVRLPCAE